MSKKKNNKDSPSSSFAINWEVQAEQLKYSVKKEVEEGNLIQEALKSLQRSFNDEEEKRILAETKRDTLEKQILDLEKSAKQLQDKIKALRRQRKGTESDSDDDISDSHSITENTDISEENNDDDNEELEYEDFLREIRGDDFTFDYDAKMTVQQRLKLLQGLQSNALDSDRSKKKLTENHKQQHKIVLKEWIKRETGAKKLFETRDYNFELTTKIIQTRQKYLERFIRSETQNLTDVNIIIENYLAAFIKSKILSQEHLKIVFCNIASLKYIYEDIIKSTQSILDLNADFRILGQIFEVHSEAFLQFLNGRKESATLVKAASGKPRFKSFLKSANISSDELQQLRKKLVKHIAGYPKKIMDILNCVSDDEYIVLARALWNIRSVLQQSKVPFFQSNMTNKLSILLIQSTIDWLNKEPILYKPGRQIITQADIIIRNDDKSTENCHYYLFSDVIIITREYKQKQIFRCFIELYNAIIWDVPPRTNNKEFIVELVNTTDGKKIVILCNSKNDHEKIISETINASLELQ